MLVQQHTKHMKLNQYEVTYRANDAYVCSNFNFATTEFYELIAVKRHGVVTADALNAYNAQQKYT